MGHSSSALSTSTALVSAHLSEHLPGLVVHSPVGSYRLFQVVRVSSDDKQLEGDLLVKIYIPGDEKWSPKTLRKLELAMAEMRDAISFRLHPNVLPMDSIQISSRSVVFLRQYFSSTLAEKVHARPFLTDLDRRWIVFQLVAAVAQLHSFGFLHGDIKMENVIVCPGLHVLLTDMATFKPVYLRDDDPVSAFSTFFESEASSRKCLIAPERIISRELLESLRGGDEMPSWGPTAADVDFSVQAQKMDVFSLGCVISEVFAEGSLAIGLPELLEFRKGKSDPRKRLSEKIQDPAMRRMVSSMLSLNPSQRHGASVYLRQGLNNGLFPTYFLKVFFPITSIFSHPVFQIPDCRIDFFRANLGYCLHELCGNKAVVLHLGVEATSPMATQKMLERMLHPLDEVGKAQVYAACRKRTRACPAEYTSRFKRSTEEQANGESSRSMPFPQPRLSAEGCIEFSEGLLSLWAEGSKIHAKDVETPQDSVGWRYYCKGGRAAEIYGSLFESHTPEEKEESGEKDPCAFGLFMSMLCAVDVAGAGRIHQEVYMHLVEVCAPFASIQVVNNQIVPQLHALLGSERLGGAMKRRTLQALTSVLKGFYRFEDQGLVKSDLNVSTEKDDALDSSGSASSAVASDDECRDPQLKTETLRSLELSLGLSPDYIFPLLLTLSKSSDSILVLSEIGKQVPLLYRIHVDLNPSNELAYKDIFETIVFELVSRAPPGARAGNKLDSFGKDRPNNFSKQLKIANLRNLASWVEELAREAVQRVILPFLICFATDQNWQVRFAFCRAMNSTLFLSSKSRNHLGRVALEGVVWPCFEQILSTEAFENVLQACLWCLVKCTGAGFFSRHLLLVMLEKLRPLLVSPSSELRTLAVKVFESVAQSFEQVDVMAFLFPLLRPLMDCPSLPPLLVFRNRKLLTSYLPQPVSPEKFEKMKAALCASDPDKKSTNFSIEKQSSGDPKRQYNVYIQFYEHISHLVRSQIFFGSGDQPLSISSPVPRTFYSLEKRMLEGFCLVTKEQFQSDLDRELSGSFPQWDAMNANPEKEHGDGQSTSCPVDFNWFPSSFELLKSCIELMPPKVQMSPSYQRKEGSLLSTSAGLGAQHSSSDIANMQELEDAQLPGRIRETDKSIGGIQVQRNFLGSGLALKNCWPLGWQPKGSLVLTLYDGAKKNDIVPCCHVKRSDNGKVLLAGYADGTVKMWNARGLLCTSPQESQTAASFDLPPDSFRFSYAVEFIRGEEAVLLGLGGPQGLQVLDVQTNVVIQKTSPLPRVLQTFGACQSNLGRTFLGSSSHEHDVLHMQQWQASSSPFCSGITSGGLIFGWDLRTPSAWALSSLHPESGSPSPRGLTVIPDSHSLISSTTGGSLSLFDLRFLKSVVSDWRVSSSTTLLAVQSSSQYGVWLLAGDMESSQISHFEGPALLSEGQEDISPSICLSLCADGNLQRKFPTLRKGSAAVSSINETCLRLKRFHQSPAGIRSFWQASKDGNSSVFSGGHSGEVNFWNVISEKSQRMVPPGDEEVEPSFCGVLNREIEETRAYREPHSCLEKIDEVGREGAAYLINERERGWMSSSSGRDECLMLSQSSPVLPFGQQNSTSLVMPPSFEDLGGSGDPQALGVGEAHSDAILDLTVVSNPQNFIVTGGRDGLVKIWV